LPASRREDYIKRPYFCPFCEHPVIEATKLESFENMVYQWVRCPECETEWHDLFELYGIEEVVAGK
jgi:formate dehydrogenase maturation protein FdhE